MSIAFLDPGNIESDLQAGTIARYKVNLCKIIYLDDNYNISVEKKKFLNLYAFFSYYGYF